MNMTTIIKQKTRQPTTIILEIKELVKELEKNLKELTTLNTTVDVNSVVNDIIASIKNETDAELSLDYECLHIVKEALHSYFSDEATDVAVVINQFGKKLFELIKQYGIYEKGYMSYRFGGLLGMDLILRIDREVLLARLFMDEKDHETT